MNSEEEIGNIAFQSFSNELINKTKSIYTQKMDLENTYSLNYYNKGMNIGNLNIQGIFGDNMNKFSELNMLLTSPDNTNQHIFGMSESKLKYH